MHATDADLLAVLGALVALARLTDATVTDPQTERELTAHGTAAAVEEFSTYLAAVASL